MAKMSCRDRSTVSDQSSYPSPLTRRAVTRTRSPALRTLPSRSVVTPSVRAISRVSTARPLNWNDELRAATCSPEMPPRALSSSSAMPSQKKSWSLAALRSEKERTAIEGTATATASSDGCLSFSAGRCCTQARTTPTGNPTARTARLRKSPKYRSMSAAESRQLIGGKRAQPLGRRRLDVRLLEDLGARPLQLGEIGQFGPHALPAPLAQEAGQLASQLGERGVSRRVGLQIILCHGVERPVAEEKGEFGKVLAQRIDLPPDEHVGVDVDARPRVELASAGEQRRGIEVRASGRPRGELVEQTLHLGQIHDATALQPSTSASMAAALRLSPTRTSSSGM